MWEPGSSDEDMFSSSTHSRRPKKRTPQEKRAEGSSRWSSSDDEAPSPLRLSPPTAAAIDALRREPRHRGGSLLGARVCEGGDANLRAKPVGTVCGWDCASRRYKLFYDSDSDGGSGGEEVAGAPHVLRVLTGAPPSVHERPLPRLAAGLADVAGSARDVLSNLSAVTTVNNGRNVPDAAPSRTRRVLIACATPSGAIDYSLRTRIEALGRQAVGSRCAILQAWSMADLEVALDAHRPHQVVLLGHAEKGYNTDEGGLHGDCWLYCMPDPAPIDATRLSVDTHADRLEGMRIDGCTGDESSDAEASGRIARICHILGRHSRRRGGCLECVMLAGGRTVRPLATTMLSEGVPYVTAWRTRVSGAAAFSVTRAMLFAVNGMPDVETNAWLGKPLSTLADESDVSGSSADDGATRSRLASRATTAASGRSGVSTAASALSAVSGVAGLNSAAAMARKLARRRRRATKERKESERLRKLGARHRPRHKYLSGRLRTSAVPAVQEDPYAPENLPRALTYIEGYNRATAALEAAVFPGEYGNAAKWVFADPDDERVVAADTRRIIVGAYTGALAAGIPAVLRQCQHVYGVPAVPPAVVKRQAVFDDGLVAVLGARSGTVDTDGSNGGGNSFIGGRPSSADSMRSMTSPAGTASHRAADSSAAASACRSLAITGWTSKEESAAADGRGGALNDAFFTFGVRKADKLRGEAGARDRAAFAAIRTLPGCGASVIAAQLALDPEVQSRYHGGVFWVAYVAGMPVLGKLREVVRELGVVDAGQLAFQDTTAGGRAIHDLMAKRPCLVVADGVTTTRQVSAFLSCVPHHGCVLFTTAVPSIPDELEVPVMKLPRPTEAEACAIAAAWARKDATETQRDADALQLVRAASNVPLAIALAAALVQPSAKRHSRRPGHSRMRSTPTHALHGSPNSHPESPVTPPGRISALSPPAGAGLDWDDVVVMVRPRDASETASDVAFDTSDVDTEVTAAASTGAAVAGKTDRGRSLASASTGRAASPSTADAFAGQPSRREVSVGSNGVLTVGVPSRSREGEAVKRPRRARRRSLDMSAAQSQNIARETAALATAQRDQRKIEAGLLERKPTATLEGPGARMLALSMAADKHIKEMVTRVIDASVALLGRDARKQYEQMAIFPQGTPVPISTLARWWRSDGMSVVGVADLISTLTGRALLSVTADGAAVLSSAQCDYLHSKVSDGDLLDGNQRLLATLAEVLPGKGTTGELIAVDGRAGWTGDVHSHGDGTTLLRPWWGALTSRRAASPGPAVEPGGGAVPLDFSVSSSPPRGVTGTTSRGDTYLQDALAWHMSACGLAERVELYHLLLRFEWIEGKLASTGSLSGLLRDFDIAIEAAAAAAEDSTLDGEEDAVGDGPSVDALWLPVLRVTRNCARHISDSVTKHPALLAEQMWNRLAIYAGPSEPPSVAGTPVAGDDAATPPPRPVRRQYASGNLPTVQGQPPLGLDALEELVAVADRRRRAAVGTRLISLSPCLLPAGGPLVHPLSELPARTLITFATDAAMSAHEALLGGSRALVARALVATDFGSTGYNISVLDPQTEEGPLLSKVSPKSARCVSLCVITTPLLADRGTLGGKRLLLAGLQNGNVDMWEMLSHDTKPLATLVAQSEDPNVGVADMSAIVCPQDVVRAGMPGDFEQACLLVTTGRGRARVWDIGNVLLRSRSPPASRPGSGAARRAAATKTPVAAGSLGALLSRTSSATSVGSTVSWGAQSTVDGETQVVDPDDVACVATFPIGEAVARHVVAFKSNAGAAAGRVLVALGSDVGVQIWDPAARDAAVPLRTLGHSRGARVGCLAVYYDSWVAPDGRVHHLPRLVAGAGDVLHVYDADAAPDAPPDDARDDRGRTTAVDARNFGASALRTLRGFHAPVVSIAAYYEGANTPAVCPSTGLPPPTIAPLEEDSATAAGGDSDDDQRHPRGRAQARRRSSSRRDSSPVRPGRLAHGEPRVVALTEDGHVSVYDPRHAAHNNPVVKVGARQPGARAIAEYSAPAGAGENAGDGARQTDTGHRHGNPLLRRFVAGGGGRPVNLLEGKARTLSKRGHHGAVSSLAVFPIAPSERGLEWPMRAVTASARDRELIIWDVDAGDRIVMRLRGHLGHVQSLVPYVVVDEATGERTTRIASAGDGSLEVWDPTHPSGFDGRTHSLETIRGHGEVACMTVFTPLDNKPRIVTSGGTDVNIWDGTLRAPALLLAKLEFHDERVCAMSVAGQSIPTVSRRGRVVHVRDQWRLVTASTSGVIIVSDPMSKQLLYRVTGHPGRVTGLVAYFGAHPAATVERRAGLSQQPARGARAFLSQLGAEGPDAEDVYDGDDTDDVMEGAASVVAGGPSTPASSMWSPAASTRASVATPTSTRAPVPDARPPVLRVLSSDATHLTRMWLPEVGPTPIATLELQGGGVGPGSAAYLPLPWALSTQPTTPAAGDDGRAARAEGHGGTPSAASSRGGSATSSRVSSATPSRATSRNSSRQASRSPSRVASRSPSPRGARSGIVTPSHPLTNPRDGAVGGSTPAAATTRGTSVRGGVASGAKRLSVDVGSANALPLSGAPASFASVALPSPLRSPFRSPSRPATRAAIGWSQLCDTTRLPRPFVAIPGGVHSATALSIVYPDDEPVRPPSPRAVETAASRRKRMKRAGYYVNDDSDESTDSEEEIAKLDPDLQAQAAALAAKLERQAETERFARRRPAVNELRGHHAAVLCCATGGPRGLEMVVTCGEDMVLRVWDPRRRKQVARYALPEDLPTVVRFAVTPDGRELVVVGFASGLLATFEFKTDVNAASGAGASTGGIGTAGGGGHSDDIVRTAARWGFARDDSSRSLTHSHGSLVLPAVDGEGTTDRPTSRGGRLRVRWADGSR